MSENHKKNYYFNINGKQVPNEEAMLSKLLDDGILFCGDEIFEVTDERYERIVVLCVLANDIFVPAADAEYFNLQDLPKLFELCEKYGESGKIIWLCHKRKMQPKKILIEMLKRENLWDDELEKLEKNKIW